MEFLKRLWAFLSGDKRVKDAVKSAGQLIVDGSKDALISVLRDWFGRLTYSEKIAMTPGNIEVSLHRVIAGASVPTLAKSTAELLVTDAISRCGIARSIPLSSDRVNRIENAVITAITGAKL